MLKLHKELPKAKTPHDKVEDHFVEVTDMIATSGPLAVSRKPMASPALVYELYGLTEEEIRIVEGTGG